MQIVLLTMQRLTLFAANGCSGGATVDLPTTAQGGSQNFDTCLPTVAGNGSVLASIIRLAFGVIGAIAIIYLMYGAFRFVRSQGEPKEINQARNTILYAIIGLVIAVSAEAIVTFALGRL